VGQGDPGCRHQGRVVEPFAMSALCQWWTSPAAVRVVSTRAEQPFGIIVDALSGGRSPPAPYPQPPGVEPRLLRQLGFILLRARQPHRVRQGPLDAGSLGLRSPVRSNSAVLVRSLHVSLTCQRAFPLLERPPLSARLFSLAPVWAWPWQPSALQPSLAYVS